MPSASSRFAHRGRRESRHRQHAAAAAGAGDGAVDASRERRPHLARGTDDQDVAVQAADAVEIGVGWLGEEVLERALVADLRW